MQPAAAASHLKRVANSHVPQQREDQNTKALTAQRANEEKVQNKLDTVLREAAEHGGGICGSIGAVIGVFLWAPKAPHSPVLFFDAETEPSILIKIFHDFPVPLGVLVSACRMLCHFALSAKHHRVAEAARVRTTIL